MKLEPALIRGLIVAVLTVAGAVAALAAGRGDEVDRELLLDALVVLIVFLGPVLGGVWTRFAVTPNAKVVARVDTSEGVIVAGETSSASTGVALEAEASVSSRAETSTAVVVPVDLDNLPGRHRR